MYPTNVVMRGIVVLPGVSRIKLHFTLFLGTGAALWCLAAGAALGVFGARGWRRE